MATEQAFQIAKHAEILATVCLTRRSELAVIPVSRYNREAGYDLLVQLNDEKTDPNMNFAVVVAGMLGSHREPPEESAIVHYSRSKVKNIGLPLCIFLFNVDSEQGYYRWLYEPTTYEDGRPYLRLDRQLAGINERSRAVRMKEESQPLDTDALQRIVDQVKHWYQGKHEHERAVS